MITVGGALRLDSTGGRRPGGAGRRRGAATGCPVAALILLAAAAGLAACQTPLATSTGEGAAAAAAFRSSIDAGLELYESREFPIAAEYFQHAAFHASRLGDRELERNAVVSECLAWMRARSLGELSDCSRRLEALQRRMRRSDPAVNTLIAFGAIAGGRPLPPLRIPNAVRPLVVTVSEDR